MSIKTVRHPACSLDLATCNFCLFPKLRGCRYETIEEMKEAVTKVIDTLTQEDLHGAFKKFLEWYKNCIAAGEDYFEGDKSFMSVLSIKVPIRKTSGNISYALRKSIVNVATFNLRTLNTINPQPEFSASVAEHNTDSMCLQERKYHHSKLELEYHDGVIDEHLCRHLQWTTPLMSP